MKYWLHPEAAAEHTRQVAYYEETQRALGRRYHTDFLEVLSQVCASPDRYRIVAVPNVRRAMFKVFHFDFVYREVVGAIQVLAIPHHRRQPGYRSKRA